MKKYIFNKKSLSLSLICLYFLSNENKQKLNSLQKLAQNTKLFIWGNGLYQPLPEATMQFKNFQPKLIKNFKDTNKINVSQKKYEFAIDNQGQLYAWTRPKLLSNFTNDPKDHERENILLLDAKNSNYVQIVCTQGFLWALNQKGEVYQWPINQNQNQIEPKQQRKLETLPKNITQIASGNDHFLALTQQGEIYTLGDDTYGQCGLGSLDRISSPPFYERRVKNPRKVPFYQEKIVKIACGSNHSLAITQEGSLYGWGSNSNLQISQEDQFSKAEQPCICIYEPIKISKNLENSRVVDVAGGEEHTMIVTVNKSSEETEVFGCGHNNKGELGAGFVRHLADVVKVEGLSNFKIKDKEGNSQDVRIDQIACGKHHCIAKLNIGVVMEWGENEFGQLGNQKRAFSDVPLIINSLRKEKVVAVFAGQDSSAVVCEES